MHIVKTIQMDVCGVLLGSIPVPVKQYRSMRALFKSALPMHGA